MTVRTTILAEKNVITKKDFDQATAPFTENIRLFIRDEDHNVVPVYYIRYEIVKGEGRLLLCP